MVLILLSNNHCFLSKEAFGLEFLRQHHVTEKNFLMVLAPPAPHAPFTPAPKYKDRYKNVTAMRTPNFNVPVFRVSNIYDCSCTHSENCLQ
jgi:hypothetical protein